MAQETLNRIKEAELNAGQMLKDARNNAARILSDAKEELSEYTQETLAGAKKKAASELEKAQSGLDAALAAADEEAGQKVEKLKKEAADKEEAAIKMVLDHIL